MKILNMVNKKIKQITCKHEWKIKGFGTMDNADFISTERRCIKCKKIEYTLLQKGINKKITV